MSEAHHPTPGPIRIPRTFRVRLILGLTAAAIISLAAVGIVLYLVTGQVIDQNYYSAHRELQRIDRNLLPALALVVGGLAVATAGAVFLIVSLALRRIERTASPLIAILDGITQGNLVAGGEPGSAFLAPAEQEAGRAREVLRLHIDAIKPVVEDMNKAALKLNYHAFERDDLTVQQVRELATELAAHIRRVQDSVRWFTT